MFCPYCGKELPNPDAAFCPFCGGAMEETGLETEVEDRFEETGAEKYSSPVKKIRYVDQEEKSENEKKKPIFPILISILAIVLATLLLLLNDGIREKIFGREPVVTDVAKEEAEESMEEPEIVSQEEVEQEPVVEEKEKHAGVTVEDYTPVVQKETEEEKQETFQQDGQIFPDSSTRVLSWSEIDSLNATQVQDAINEIFARRGYIFNDETYLNYYKQFPWYHGTISSDRFTNDLFSDTELENVERLSKRRAELSGN